jgi:hypothetical protein
MERKATIRKCLIGLGAGLVGLANSAIAGMEYSLYYSRAFNNISAEKTVFTSETSPDQEHGLNAGFYKFGFSGAHVSDKSKKGIRFKTGAEIFYGQANDSVDDIASYGTEDLEGTADFELNADVLGIGAFVGAEKRFFKDRFGLAAKAGVEVAKVDAKLDGRGYVSSSSGDFAAGTTLNSKIDDILYDAYVGASVSYDLGADFTAFAEAKYGLGNELSWDETTTTVNINGETGTGTGITSGSATLAGFEAKVGVKKTF